MTLMHKPVLWNVDQVAGMLKAKPLGGIAGRAIVGRFSTSAPVTIPGDVYVPLNGSPEKKIAGVERAMALGAAATIVPRTLQLPPGTPAIRVENPRMELRKLATAGRNRFAGQIIGVTGSVGKTTTKDLIAHLLSYAGPTHFTHANFNAGAPILATVASLPPLARYSVAEIALSRPQAVSTKASVVRPHVGVITSIGSSHGVYQTGKGSILESKMSLYDHIVAGGTAVLPSSSPSYRAMVDMLADNPRIGRVISCGKEAGDDVRLIRSDQRPTYSEVTVQVYGSEMNYVIGQPGPQFVFNSLLAVGVLAAVGAPIDTAASLSSFVPTHRRVERFRVAMPRGPIELVDDAYNAAPDSVRALLQLLKRRSEARRRVLVFGDMLELGPTERELHLGLVPDILDANLDLLVTVGPLTRLVADAVSKDIKTESFDTSEQAASSIESLVKPYDLVAVKGSNGMRMLCIVNQLRQDQPLPRQGIRWSIETETPKRVAR